jgi:nucleoside-diphosphate-sugar epimerase
MDHPLTESTAGTESAAATPPEPGVPSAKFWSGRKALVTGGASFIGSHLVDALVELGAWVRVVDDLSTGRLENLAEHVRTGNIDLRRANLLGRGVAARATQGIDTVFHLAAAHGGRGYIDSHQAECVGNVVLDNLLFQSAVKNAVQKVVFTSSGCVYPVSLQRDPSCRVQLREEMVGPPYDPDGLYGWAKLTGELTLRAFHRQKGLSSASCRLFTVYGPRALESHGIIALIARAMLRQQPFEIWGDGQQVRNWTYVDDIVRGLVLAAERIGNARSVNLGSETGHTVAEAAATILSLTGHAPELRFLQSMPTGPMSRVASSALAARLLDWRPRTAFIDGVRCTVEWYATSGRLPKSDRQLAERLAMHLPATAGSA